MPALTQTVEATTEITLAPKVKRQLLADLAAYADVEKQLAELKLEKDALNASIEALREKTDAKSFAIDGGYRITRVDGGTSKSLNKKKLFALGITPDQLERCYVERPKKAYTLVTTPNTRQRKTEGEEE